MTRRMSVDALFMSSNIDRRRPSTAPPKGIGEWKFHPRMTSHSQIRPILHRWDSPLYRSCFSSLSKEDGPEILEQEEPRHDPPRKPNSDKERW